MPFGPPSSAHVAHAHVRVPECKRAAMNKDVVRATQRINAECASTGDVAGARRIIEELILGRGLLPTLVTANILIKTYRAARNPEGAEAVVRELPSWGLAPDACTFSTLADAYGLAGRVADAQRMALTAESLGIADSRVYSALLRFVAPEEVEPLMERLLVRRVTYNTALCNAALSTLASAGRSADARAYVHRHMGGTADTRPDARTHTLLLKAHCAAGDVDAAESHLSELYGRQGEVKVDAAAVSMVMNACVSRSPPDMPRAHRLMDEASARGVLPDVAMYNILIKGYASTSPPQPERAEAMLAQIRARGLVPTTTSICSVMDAWCELNQEAQAQRLMEASLREGHVRPSPPLYNTLIKASSRCRCKRSRGECLCEVCRCCRPDRGLELLREMSSHGLSPDAITLNTLLDAFCCAGKLPQAWLLLESLLAPQMARGSGSGSAARGGGGGAHGRAGGGGTNSPRTSPRQPHKAQPPASFQPSPSTFAMLFRHMLRHVTKPLRPSAALGTALGTPTSAVLPIMATAAALPGCQLAAASAADAARLLSRRWHLEQFDSGLGMIEVLRPAA